MAKISYAGCLGLSEAISTQFTLEMCVAARNREEFTKTPIIWREGAGFKVIQGHSRSSVLTFLRS